MNLFLSTWVLLAAGLVFALPVIHMRVTNHTDPTNDPSYVRFSLYMPLDLSLNYF